MPDTPTALEEDTRSRIAPAWDADMIRFAERQAESGNLALPAALCAEMMKDDRVAQALRVRARSIISQAPEWEAGTGGARTALGAARKLVTQEDWFAMAPSAELGALHGWGLMLGVGFAQKLWGTAPASGRWVPMLDVWNPRGFRYDHDTKRWTVRISGGTHVDATAEQFVIYTPFGAKSPAARGAWTSVARWWLLKQYAVSDWMKQGQQARGSTVLKPPPPGTSGGRTAGEELDVGAVRARRKELIREIQQRAEDRLMFLPPGWDMQLVQMEASTHATYQAQIELADRGIAIAMNGQNLTSDVQGGSYAAAQVHRNVEQTLLAADTEALVDCLHDQLLVPWAAYNLREGAGGAPWPKWNTTPPRDLDLYSKNLTAYADALGKWNGLLAPLGHEVDVLAAAREVGLAVIPTVARTTKREVFAYHLQYGLLTKNEAREYLGLPPVADGNEAPVPVAAPTASAA